MTVYTSTGTGNWNNAATWGGGGYPVTGDTAIVQHTVTVTAAAACRIVEIDGGSLVLNADLTLDDHADARFIIRDTSSGALSSNGTATTHRTIKSAGGDSPSNPWTWLYEAQAGTDDRTLDFDYINIEGCLWYLGNDNYEVDFNDGADDDSPFITSVTPLERTPILTEHNPEDRAYGRVYPRGATAGAVTFSGSCSWASRVYDTIKKMIADGERVAFFSRYVCVPHARIERSSFVPKMGGHINFSITIREEH